MQNLDNIIKLAWCDRTSFEKIERIHGVNESGVIKIMRKNGMAVDETSMDVFTMATVVEEEANGDPLMNHT